MSRFVDLVGASGARYRFRLWSEAGQVPIAGNFAVAVKAAGGVAVLLLGVTTDLSRAAAHAQAAGLAGKPLFVRLNVARSTRRLEHADLMARHAPSQVFEDGADGAT